MSDLRINDANLPPECVKDLQVYLRTSEIIAREVDGGFQADILGVPCVLACSGLGLDSLLVLIAARPLESGRWNFGTCFHELPGATEEASPQRRFRMRFLTLRRSLWLFVWGRDVKQADVRVLLASNPGFRLWTRERGAADAAALFDTLGFDARELQAVPHASWRAASGEQDVPPGNAYAGASASGLFLWGDLNETSPTGAQGNASALTLLTDGLATFLGTGSALFTKAKVECEGGYAHLTLRMPAGTQALPSAPAPSGGDALAFRNIAVQLTSIPYFTPQDTTIVASAAFDLVLLGEKSEIEMDLIYPIDGDLIRARGSYTGNVKKLLGGENAFEFPGWERAAEATRLVEVNLEFSRSARTLVRLSFSIEARQLDWGLIETPVSVKLDGVSFQFTVLQPLKPSRSVHSRIAFDTKLGDVQLACGGSYPGSELFFRSTNRGIPVGTLVGQFLGVAADEGLDRFAINDLRLAYNYTSKHLGLQFDVPDRWEIAEGREIGNLRFRIRGDASYEGSVSGTLKIAGVPIDLEATYKDRGWEFRGETGAMDMAQLFTDDSVPAALRKLRFDQLKLVFNTGVSKRRFLFSGKTTLDIEGHPLQIELSVEATEKAGQFEKKFHGVLALKVQDTEVRFRTDIAQVGKHVVLAFSGAVPGGVRLTDAVAGIAVQLGALDQVPDIPDVLNLALRSVSGHLNTGTRDLVLRAETESGSTLLVVISGATGNRKSAVLIDKVLHLGLSSLPLVGDQIASASGRAIGIEDVGIERLQAMITQGVRNEKAEYAEDIGLLNGIIRAAEGQPGELPRLMETAQAQSRPGDPQFRLRVTCYIADRLQPPMPFQDGPASQAGLTSGRGAPVEVRPAQAQATWLDVQRSFGPVSVRRMGIAFVDGHVRLLMDASLAVAGLSMELQGLSLGFPVAALAKFDRTQLLASLARLADPERLSTRLDGLSLSYENGPIAISGGLLSVNPPPDTSLYACNGQLMLKANTWALSVVGSFAQLKSGESSLFAYGVLNAIIGGPAFFFVTGIAAGFGYNRSLTLPTLNALPEFPLVKAVMAQAQRGRLTEDIQQFVYPAAGQNWVAAGVRFTSFKVFDSFALLTVFFGDRLEFGLLGYSEPTVPAVAKTGAQPIARAGLALEARYAPDDGVLKIAAQLTPESFILSENCHLSGGFALYTWSQDEYEKDVRGNIVPGPAGEPGKLARHGFRSGDFVLSIGGYHPDFKPPAHYPCVPRVSANWRVNDNLKIKGSLYFAMTPLAIMAGGMLEANYERGHLKAWFSSRVDFLMYWEPLAYHAHMKVNMGASYTMGWGAITKTISAQVGADVELYGPPFGGRAVFDLSVCSFTLDFGDQAQTPQKLDWQTFAERFLPDASQVCQSRAAGGLIKELSTGQGGEPVSWIVNAEQLVIATSSAIPCSEPAIVKNGKGHEVRGGTVGASFGVQPCELLNDRLKSQQTIVFEGESGLVVEWDIKSITERLPRSAWHAKELTSAADRKALQSRILKELAEDQVCDELTVGYLLTPKRRMDDTAHGPAPIELSALPMRSRGFAIAGGAWETPAIPRAGKYTADNQSESRRYTRLSEVDSASPGGRPDIMARRKAVADALKRQGIELVAQPHTGYLAAAACKHALLAAPSICELGAMQTS